MIMISNYIFVYFTLEFGAFGTFCVACFEFQRGLLQIAVCGQESYNHDTFSSAKFVNETDSLSRLFSAERCTEVGIDLGFITDCDVLRVFVLT